MDRKDLDLVCVFLFVQRDAVRHDKLREDRIRDALVRRATQHGVRAQGAYRFGTVLNHERGRFGQRASGVTHVIDDDHVFAAYVTNDGHR